mgnify:CR=1 FL=1
MEPLYKRHRPREPERTVAERAQQLEYLMRRFGDEVLHLAYFYLKDRHAAEDVAQEVFLRVYCHLDDFTPEGSYHNWIYRITVNLCHDRLRSWTSRKVFAAEDLSGGEPTPRCVAVDVADTEAQAIRSWEAERLLEAVMSLEPKYREVIALHYYSDLPVKQIAQLTGLTEANVKVRLHRARQRIRELLREEGGREGEGGR